MEPRKLSEDRIYYRIEYARIARLLEKITEDEQKGRGVGKTEGREAFSAEEEMVPQISLSLPKTTSRTINDVLRPLTAEQRDEGERSTDLWQDAACLASSATAELERLRWHWVGRRPAWYRRHWRQRHQRNLLGEFLDGVLEPSATVLYFSCRIQANHTDEVRKAVRAARAVTSPLKRPRNQVPDSWRIEYLADLLATTKPTPRPKYWRYLRWAYRLAELEADILARLGVARFRRRAKPSFRVRYNLACLFSRLAETSQEKADDLENAEEQLRLAFESVSRVRRIGMAEKAWEDPALEALRSAKNYDFSGIVPLPPKRS